MRLALAAALALTLTGSSALAGAVRVPMDEARTVTFQRPVGTIFVANPVIADVHMVDQRHAFVVGKAFGTTNIIALDSTGREVSNTLVSVAEAHGSTVTYFLGANQRTLSCAGPRCEVSPIPGDAKFRDEYQDVNTHHDIRTKTAQE